MITWQEWCYIIGGYLSGSILYSYLLPKALKGIDITAESPDGNPGTANAFTCAGIPIVHGTAERLSSGASGIAGGESGTMELCADSGSSGFRTCLPVFTATERWKSHCGIVRGTAGAGTVLASGTVSGSPVSDLFPGDRDRSAFLPFGLYLCTVFRQYFLSGVDDRYQCRLLSDLGCGDPESLRQISGRADECATGTSSVRKRQGISTVMIVC